MVPYMDCKELRAKLIFQQLHFALKIKNKIKQCTIFVFNNKSAFVKHMQ
jgi:hypothetical protein